MHVRRLGPRSLVAALFLAGFAAIPANASPDGEPGAAPSPPDPSLLSVERIYGGEKLTGPMPEGLSWRPKHDEFVAWRGEKEDRALWVSDAATGAEKRLVAVSDFDPWLKPKDKPPEVAMHGIGRAGPPSYLWAPTGDAIFLVFRGDVYRADLATGRRMRCTQTTSPISDVQIAPDGLHFSFARDHDLWAVVVEKEGDAEKAREIRLTTGGSETIRNGDLDWVYPEELDCKTAAWWSPDSTRVAFLQLDETKVAKFPIVDYMPRLGSVTYEFFPKAGDANPVPRVGVVGLEGKPPVWIELAVDREFYVPWAAWLPEAAYGDRLMVAVISRDQRQMDLRVCDAADGKESWGWHPTVVSSLWDIPCDAPRFLATRSSRWLWNSNVCDLLKDKFQNFPILHEDAQSVVGVDEDANAVFSAGPGPDLVHQIVTRVALEGAPPVRVTDDTASHHASFSNDGKWFLDTESKATVPPKITLRKADGTAVRVVADSMTPQFAALHLEPPEFGRVPAKGDLPDLIYSLRKPHNFVPAKKYPVIVHTYGGPGAQLVRDEFGGLFDALLAQEGFAVFTLDNRGSAGRGKAFETPIYRQLGKVELEDQVRGVEWLKSQPWVDGSRIGIWGWSYGGYMTCYAMTRAPDVFKAGVAVAPVTDWRLYDTIYTERYMGLPKDNEEGYKNSSPITFAKDLKGALLLCHGLSDDNVHVQNTIQFSEALIRARKPFDLMLYPQRAHGIEGADAHVHLFHRILEHFRRNL